MNGATLKLIIADAIAGLPGKEYFTELVENLKINKIQIYNMKYN